MIRAIVVFGTRPEAIKLAPVIKRLSADAANFKVATCVTGQHREMLDQILQVFDIVPEHDLGIMTHNQSLHESSSQCLRLIEPVLKAEAPDIVIVQGDTTSAFIVSLASFYMKIPVAHVEAGLRTGTKYQPFPEEINRTLISAVADIHFAPTEAARNNLLRSGIDEEAIHVTGNTVIDALLLTIETLRRDEWRLDEIRSAFPVLRNLAKNRLILVTCHRRESFGSGLEGICHALADIVEEHPDVLMLFPVHLNPNVQRTVYRILGQSAYRNRIFLVPPLDYPTFVYMMKVAHIILTDSGGIQEEAPTLGKPVLVLREVTERPEATEAGAARLVGTTKERIVEEARRLLSSRDEYDKMAKVVNPFGDGFASRRIHEVLLAHGPAFH